MYKSIILSQCWVCNSTVGLNNHHCIPQAYGGVDGPQVTLCASHHGFIHAVALKELASREYLLAEHTKDKTQFAKLVSLIDIIAKARAATKGIEKPLMVQHKFNKERGKKLRELKYMLGKKSINATLDACIDIIHAQNLQLKPTRKT